MGYNRNAETQRRLKNKYTGRYSVPIYFDEEKGIWRRYYWSRKGKSSYVKYLKKKCSRASRRSKEIYRAKGAYRKEFDYWWELL
jgi:hypothetical protein